MGTTKQTSKKELSAKELKKVFGANFSKYLDKSGLTQDDIAQMLNVSQSSVSGWKHGLALPRAGALEQLTKIFGCNKSDLLEDKAKTPIHKGVSVPIYDLISCGTGNFVDSIPDDTMFLPSSLANPDLEYFCNPASGDSMEPLISSGDYLVFERTDIVPVGKIGSFFLNGEYYCKRFKKLPDQSYWLFSENPEYDPIPIQKEDDFRPIGLYRYKLSLEQ